MHNRGQGVARGRSQHLEDIASRMRSKLAGVAGTHLDEGDVVKLLNQTIQAGGGVRLEIDDEHFRLVRRDGKLVILKDDHRSSTVPPRR